MVATLDTMTEVRVQNTFDAIRDHLFDQFRDVPFDPDSGLPAKELERQARAYLEAHPDQPRVLQKAHLFQLVVTQGQIYVDPLDWFADKLNHGNLMR